MTPRCPAAALVLAALVALVPIAASACSTAGTGARCISVAASPRPAGPVPLVEAALAGAPALLAVAVGEVLERGEHSILLNAEYYGLPPVSDGWVYMRIDRDVFRVDWRSHRVIERVTHEAAANF